ncbi:UvrD-helicase domain-containing protein [Gammaproteobacteria bacterium]|nr:UvrD-helicase domain-containing protein [Gammaproteobacteria bacterium]
MDISPIIDTLNEPQRHAAMHTNKNVLVLAGAGSGKTKTMVHRMAYLISTGQAHWHQILAVTFTNKAANELKSRVTQLMPEQRNAGLWTGTFHGICHKMLRIHHQDCGLNANFLVIDADEQLRLIKKIHKEMMLDEQKWPPKKTMAYINQQKESGLRADASFDDSNPFLRTQSEIYQAYEDYCIQSHVVDFTELMLRICELLTQNATIRTQYQTQFKHILVDEFQDTNLLQYQLLQRLSSPEQCIFAVGDDDQSIYSWRGARVDHMFAFENDFSPVETIKLEQNYRSTSVILDTANHVIINNQKRLEKQLWTQQSGGDKIQLFPAFNELDEAQFVCEQIQQLSNKVPLSQCAILYRSNAQSRVFEEKLNQLGLPYRVYGGLRYFDRAEIKDILAYLRLIANPNDNLAFERAINYPPRGIGKVTLDKIRQQSIQQSQSLWMCLCDLRDEQQASAAILGFMQLIEQAQQHRNQLSDLIRYIIDETNIKAYLKGQKNIQTEAKIENINELINASMAYDRPEDNSDPLATFLTNTVLDQSHENKQADHMVQLMTLHSAKGLEFNHVFLVGLEDDLFPHKMTHVDPLQVEEERRLCYVGITRAQKQLYISYAETRRQYGQESYQRPSRFLHEMPSDNIQNVRIGNTLSQQIVIQKSTFSFKLGQQVSHPKFGEGVVLNYEEDGENSRVHVKFLDAGTKWLLCTYANLSLLH